jgi:hypothetical protein
MVVVSEGELKLTFASQIYKFIIFSNEVSLTLFYCILFTAWLLYLQYQHVFSIYTFITSMKNISVIDLYSYVKIVLRMRILFFRNASSLFRWGLNGLK